MLLKKTKVLCETTDLPQVIKKLGHLMVYWLCHRHWMHR